MAGGLDGLSILIATVRRQGSFTETVEGSLRQGIGAIPAWRAQFAAAGLAGAARMRRVPAIAGVV